MDAALQTLSAASTWTRGLPRRVNGNLTLTVTGREAIPELLNLLVQHHIRVYHMAAHQPTLEDVYFALHGEKESAQ
jgi:ABC-2 type transport system ATP-binding protein